MDDFDDMDGLFSDLDRDSLADDVGAPDDVGADGLTDDDWAAAFAPFVDDGSMPDDVLADLWDALADWEAEDFDLIVDYDVDAGEGNYL